MSPLVHCVLPAAFAVSIALAGGPTSDASAIEFFEKQVRPVLVRNCVSCHGPTQQFSSLRLDSRASILKGGNRGPAVEPGNAGASRARPSGRPIRL